LVKERRIEKRTKIALLPRELFPPFRHSPPKHTQAPTQHVFSPPRGLHDLLLVQVFCSVLRISCKTPAIPLPLCERGSTIFQGLSQICFVTCHCFLDFFLPFSICFGPCRGRSLRGLSPHPTALSAFSPKKNPTQQKNKTKTHNKKPKTTPHTRNVSPVFCRTPLLQEGACLLGWVKRWNLEPLEVRACQRNLSFFFAPSLTWLRSRLVQPQPPHLEGYLRRFFGQMCEGFFLRPPTKGSLFLFSFDSTSPMRSPFH